MGQATCSFEECVRPHYAKGLCGGHYQQQKAGRELSRLRGRGVTNGGPCRFEGCGRTSRTLGFCTGHYTQHQKGRELTPLKVKSAEKRCSFDDCDRAHVSGGFCYSHYRQARKGGGLRKIADVRSSLTRNAHGQKQCRICKSWFDVSEFRSSGSMLDGLDSRCSVCIHASHIERLFNLSSDMYRRILDAQGGGCAVCGGGPGVAGRSFHVDHDHSCCPESGRSCGNCIRGLLCNNCNTAVGLMRDDPARLRAAADYLDLT